MKKKNIKKIVVVLFLSLFLAFSLTACSDGLWEGFFAIGVIFLLLVGVFYVFITIADETSSSRTEDILEKVPERYFPPGYIENRNKWMDEWVAAEYKRHPENGAIIWRWIDFDNYNKIEFTLDNEGITYVGDVIYSVDERPSCPNQERVLRIESVVKGTDKKKIWEGTETEQHKQYKKRAAELAFKHYSNAYELDESVADKMADLYFNGIGTDQDENRGDEILMRSAQNGGIEERYRYAKFCLDNGMKTKANEWFEAALLAQDASEQDTLVKEIEQMQL